MLQTDVPVKDRQDWKNYRLPDPASPHRVKMIRDAVKANEPEIGIIAGFLGPFTMMYWYLTDLATLSLLVYDDPGLIDEMNAAYVTVGAGVGAHRLGVGRDRRLRPCR